MISSANNYQKYHKVARPSLNAPLYVAGLVAYDGTDYHGFQIQHGLRTIQGTLEEALAASMGRQSRVIGSGRTDTGVHGHGQVVAAGVHWNHTIEELQNAWNAHLPNSITIRNLVDAPTNFHPRFSAEKRTYRYTVYDNGESLQLSDRVRLPRTSPLTDRFALYVPQLLDVVAMQKAAAYLVGAHDFATFGQPPHGENTVRTVYEAIWQIVETTLPALHGYPGRRLTFTVTANAFLQRMVRNFVSTLLVIGKQQWQPGEVNTLLYACDRGRCAPPAPPQGLVLEHVVYPSEVNPWVDYS